MKGGEVKEGVVVGSMLRNPTHECFGTVTPTTSRGEKKNMKVYTFVNKAAIFSLFLTFSSFEHRLARLALNNRVNE